MRQQPTACERCGLRAVSRELERDGIVMRFCDECYWGETEAEPITTEASTQEKPAPPRHTS
jgi:ribosome-binding protein aMBF1 (putative translation factor)